MMKASTPSTEGDVSATSALAATKKNKVKTENDNTASVNKIPFSRVGINVLAAYSSSKNNKYKPKDEEARKLDKDEASDTLI